MSSQMQLVIAVVSAAVLGLMSRYVRERRVQLDASVLSDLVTFPAVVVFGSSDCASCAPVMETYTAIGVGFTELSWEQHTKVFEQIGIETVPTTWGVDPRGKVRIAVEGTPSRRELKKFELHSAR